MLLGVVDSVVDGSFRLVVGGLPLVGHWLVVVCCFVLVVPSSLLVAGVVFFFHRVLVFLSFSCCCVSVLFLSMLFLLSESSVGFLLSVSPFKLNWMLLVPVVVGLSLAWAVVINSSRLGCSQFFFLRVEPFLLSGFARLLTLVPVSFSTSP